MPAAQAVALLLESHGPRLHALALRMCRHAADADDLVQDVFLQALRKWGTFRGDADAGTWLYAIAARACKARLRRKGGIDRRVPAVSQLMPWRETTVMQVVAADAPANGPERREAIARVQAEIAKLPEHLRVPLVFKEVIGLSIEDAARTLGLSAGTIKTRLHRARLALRKAMTAHAPRVHAPAPIYEKQVCFDLLKAKMDAMDRGGTAAGFIVPKGELCARCRAVFRELDLVQEACAQMAQGDLPPRVRRAVLAEVHRRECEAVAAAPRRGRPPVSAASRPARSAKR
jgi:RNA polymerase sigma-70 factor, ECF subfamily